MKNKIIIEGFWNIGKTALARSLAEDYGHFYIPEPNHLGKNIPQKNVDSWYIKEHFKNQKKFLKKKPAVMERSVISSAAFLYAAGRKANRKALKSFAAAYKKEKPLIVFLYAAREMIQMLGEETPDPTMRKLLKSKLFIKKYEKFYRNILPIIHDIVPVFINIEAVSQRKTPEEIEREVAKIVDNNRLAQVSIFCYKIEKGKPIFLLLKRKEKRGGFWQGITGGVKMNQTLREALFKEAQEELGLNLRRKDILETGHSFSFTGSEGYELNEYVFGYKLNNRDKLFLSDEHSEYRFMPLEAGLRILKYETNKIAIKKVALGIKKHRG